MDSIAAEADVARCVAYLRSTKAVRERCGQLLARARRGESHWFAVDDKLIDATAGLIVRTTRLRYPRLDIPFHSRWRHFEAGGVDRKAQMEARLAHESPAERARTLIDLVVVSVLLDAGAGADWKYLEPGSNQTYARSEGLGIASFHAFAGGLFSSDGARPLQADAAGLQAIDAGKLAAVFQVSGTNPLVGLEGRAALLQRLGKALAEYSATYGAEGRPGGMFDALTAGTSPGSGIAAHDILSYLLDTLSGIWPAGNALAGVPLGDCWRHAALGGDDDAAAWVPFHKLSQWLTYSLLEPFVWAGVPVHGLEALTALPEYRNGGLMIDSGLLKLRDSASAERTWQPGDELIVEWRALTLALMDEVARAVRVQLGLSEAQLPLACVLEGGSWAAGRELAQKLRGGLPPLKVASDGTVF